MAPNRKKKMKSEKVGVLKILFVRYMYQCVKETRSRQLIEWQEKKVSHFLSAAKLSWRTQD